MALLPTCLLKLCYEASYIGYTLQRDLAQKAYHFDVVAPTSIPSPRGKSIKTDRIDAGQLAQFNANGFVSIVCIPEAGPTRQRWFALLPSSCEMPSTPLSLGNESS